MKYFIDGLKKYFITKGASSRSEYWYFKLFFLIFYVLILILGSDTLGNVYIFLMIIPSITISIRRLHDLGKSSYTYLWRLFPIVGDIYIFMLMIRKGKKKNNKYTKNNSIYKEQAKDNFVISFIIVVILLSVIIRTYVFQLFRVSGPSMCPTLNQFETGCEYGNGEFIFVNEFVYNFLHKPERGDIVVFEDKDLGKNLIKRVIGIPGDKVEVIDGKVYRTNANSREKIQLQEPYLSAKNQGMTRSSKAEFVVPEGKYLLFGDNRLESLDSRLCFAHGCNDHNSPFIDLEDIKGRAEFTLWPNQRSLEVVDY